MLHFKNYHDDDLEVINYFMYIMSTLKIIQRHNWGLEHLQKCSNKVYWLEVEDVRTRIYRALEINKGGNCLPQQNG